MLRLKLELGAGAELDNLVSALAPFVLVNVGAQFGAELDNNNNFDSYIKKEVTICSTLFPIKEWQCVPGKRFSDFCDFSIFFIF